VPADVTLILDEQWLPESLVMSVKEPFKNSFILMLQ
jgi:hypothetical protein